MIEIDPDLRLVLAPNPGPMTGSGTNSYLVGMGDVVLIDPGPDLPTHHAALLAALRPDERIVAILTTHSHQDHTALARRMAASTGAPILGAGPAGSGRSALMTRLAVEGLTGGGEGFDLTYTPDRRLMAGEILHFGTTTIEVLHIPGHTGCHLGYAVNLRLFAGDTVMGWSTSLISPPDGDMGAYMATLSGLLRRDWQVIHPGHGPAIRTPALRLHALITHRQQREADILSALASGPATATDLARRLYIDTPAGLLPAAARNVLAHLIDLSDRGLASPAGVHHPGTSYRRT